MSKCKFDGKMGMIVSIVRKYEMLDLLMGSAAKMN